MPVKNDPSVHSTTKTLINTVGNVREIVNTLLHYNPATTPLTDIQIRWLLHSPLESIIKNILFFEMVYGTVLELQKRETVYKILKKIGLKELALRYHEWLLKRKAAESTAHTAPEIMSQFEHYRPTPAPVAYTKEQLAQLSIKLGDLYQALTLVKGELSSLYLKHQELVQNLILLNAHHVDTVSTLAQDTGIQLESQQITMALPDAQTAYHKALTPQAQIRALGLLINEGVSANNGIIFVKQFLLSTALRTAMTAYEDGLGMLNIEFSMVTEAIIACQMRQADLISQIDEIEDIISNAQTNSAAPTPITTPRPESKQFVAKDLHEMLSSWSPYESSAAKTVAESKTSLSKIATTPSLAGENKLAVVLDTRITPEDHVIGPLDNSSGSRFSGNDSETSEDKLGQRPRAKA